MKNYIAATDFIGELPLYHGDTYTRALDSGRVAGLGSTNGAVSHR